MTGYAVAANILGSLFSDIDHPESMLSRKIAPVGFVIRLLTLAMGGALVYLNYHQGENSVVLNAIGTVLIISGVFNMRVLQNLIPFPVEKIILIIAGAILIVKGDSSWLKGLGILYLMMGCLSHRGMTHSLIGFIAAGVGAYFLSRNLGMVILWSLLIGYAGHLVADIFSGGVFLFYPIKQRIKAPASVKTGSFLDHMVGLGCLLYAVFIAVKI